MKIIVKQKYILNGCPNNSFQCPIALAYYDQYKIDFNEIQIGFSGIYVNRRLKYKFPRKASRFVKDFDHGKKVKPFSFIAKEIY